MFDSERDEQLVLSTRHIKLRTVLFVLAFLVAIFSFVYGIRQMMHKDPGIYEVEANPDVENKMYDHGFHLYYNFEGGSGEIRQKQSELGDFYSISLGRVVKELDPVNEYESIVSLAALNNHPGEEIELSEELVTVLKDAQSRGSNVYSLYNGPLYALWEDVLSLSEPLESDPLNDPNVAERIEAFRALEEGVHGELRFNGNKVTYMPGEGYLDFIAENEYPANYIDLNLLHDAYVLRLVADDLVRNGWTNGFLQSDSGVLVFLGEVDIEGLNLCGFDSGNNTLKNVAVLPASAVMAMSRFTIAGGESSLYYTITGEDGNIHYRHPYYLSEGIPQEKYAVSYVINNTGDPVDAVCRNLSLQEGELPESDGYFYSLLGETDICYSNLTKQLKATDQSVEIREADE